MARLSRKASRVERLRELLERAKRHPERSPYRTALLREAQDLVTKQLRSEIRADRKRAAA